MSHRFDERKENIQKIKEDIRQTQGNVEFASDMISSITDVETKKELKEQNERRQKSLQSMIEDVKEKVLD